LRSGLADRTVVLVTHNLADIRPEDDLLDLSQPEVPGAVQRPSMVPAS
jgi:ATP-binding cassette subfamily C protein CydCD